MFDVWLKRRMAEHGLDNAKLAEALEIDASAVGKWLLGVRKPSRRQVIRLSRLFHVSPVTILRLTDPDELLALVDDKERQEDLIEMIEQVPELRSIVERLRRVSPERRAAWLTLLADGGTDSP